MIVSIVMPRIGFAMEEGTIVRWLKNEGERVDKGEPILEIESDKAIIQVESPCSGYLRRILAAEGKTVPVQRVIGYVGELDDQIPASNDLVQEGTSDSGKGEPRAEQLAGERESKPVDGSDRMKISPRARRLAKERGITDQQLRGLRGTGYDGIITENDIAVLIREGETEEGAGESAKVNSSTSAPISSFPSVSAYRKAIARNLTASWQRIPQFCVGGKVDASGILALKQRFDGEPSHKGGASITAILVACVARTLADNPRFNASWDNDGIVFKNDVNVGVAVATDRGLIVPVIKHADRKCLSEISSELNELKRKAREGRLALEEASGGTFTISNLGMFLVDTFQAIINPPESGILAVGRIIKQATVSDHDDIVIKPMMWLNLTVDHRVIDGSDAAMFFGRIKAMIEAPGL